MPHHQAQKKSIKQDERRHARNKSAKSALRTMEKKIRATLAGEDSAAGLLPQAQADLDRAASKKIIPARRAARKKSRLMVAATKAAQAAG